MISQTAEYALRAITHLATNPDVPQTAQQIAVGTKVPLAYLSKVLQALARGGLIHSQRGLHGGFTLLYRPDQVSVYAVLEAVDPLQRITTCPLSIAAHGTNLCPLHQRLDEAMSLVEKSFRESTIGDLLNGPATSQPLCDFAVVAANSAGESAQVN